MPGAGPMVYRSAHAGAVLVIVGVVQFVLGMAWAELLYPGYSLSGNYISDLGCCGGVEHANVFNDSIRVLGALAIVGAYLLRTAFPAKTRSRLGIAALMIAGASAFAVGSFPENSPYLGGQIHTLVSALTFFFSGLALIALSLAMLRDTRWGGYRLYTLASGLVTWVAMALFSAGAYLGIGPGGMERVVVAPVLLWGVVAGVHLLRIPGYRPGSSSGPAAGDGT